MLCAVFWDSSILFMMGTPFCQKPFFHSKNADMWVDLKRSLSVGSSLAVEEVASVRWEASVSWYVSLSAPLWADMANICHLSISNLTALIRIIPPPPVPLLCFFLAVQPNTSVMPGAFLVLCCTSSFLPNNTSLFFLLTLFHTLMAQLGCIWCIISIICNRK